jgi:hypothetical protein
MQQILKNKLIAGIILLGMVTSYSCRYHSEETLFDVHTPCDTSHVTYSGTISGIIASNHCLECHIGAAPSGNFTLTSYADVKAKVNDGRLWGAVNHFPGFSAMPEGGGKLSPCDLNKIKVWIDAGAPNN